MITSEEIATEFGAEGSFFSSAGGGPVSCAVGLAVLQTLEDEKLQQNADEVGAYLNARLIGLARKYPHTVGCIHGHGLYQGVELIRGRQQVEDMQELSLGVPTSTITESQSLPRPLLSTETPAPSYSPSSSSSPSFSSTSSSTYMSTAVAPMPATEEAYAICERLLELGVICHNTGDYSNVLKVKPPLCFSRADADFFVEALDVALQGW